MWLARRKQPPPLLPLPAVQHPPHISRLLLSSFPGLLLASALRLFCSSSASTVRRDLLPPPLPAAHFMVDYLVSSCGLSNMEAVKTSRRLAHLKSPEKPDAVVRLLKREGLCVRQIRRVVLGCPRLLTANSSRTLEPKLRMLQGAGFSGSELAQLISACPAILRHRNVLPRIEFLKDLLGSNENLLRAASRNMTVLSQRSIENFGPKVSLLRSMGISGNRIGASIVKNPELVSASVDRIKAACEELKSMGFTPDLGRSAQALSVIVGIGRSGLEARSRLLRSFGWSQADAISAFRNFPPVLAISEKKLRATMDFLLKEVGCDPSYVARCPALLGYSLVERLRPRYHVLQFLRAKGLRRKDGSLYAAMALGETKFVGKYVTPNSEEYPEIIGIYRAVGAKTIID